MTFKSSVWAAARVLLSLASPVQSLLEGNGATHLFINAQAQKILDHDGYIEQAQLFSNFLEQINSGTLWADKGWKNCAHYFNPEIKRGLRPWPHARMECGRYFAQAVQNWEKGRRGKAFFYFGAAVHLVQDICVPYHAGPLAFSGHQEYERWVQQHYADYGVSGGGIYHLALDPEGWLEANAEAALVWLEQLRQKDKEEVYPMVTACMLPRAQRTTAGFFHFFCARVKEYHL